MTRETRTELLDAAQDLFATHGYPGTSVRALAAAVGIKESSVYNHFAGKDAILTAVLARADERIDALAARLGVDIEDAESASLFYASIGPDELETIANGFLDLWLNDPDVVATRRILTLEQYRTPAAGMRLRALMVDRPLEFQTRLFARLMEEGAFVPAAPEAVALAFWGPIVAILLRADDPAAEPEARRLLAAHVAHFHQVHVAGAAGVSDPAADRTGA